MDAFSGRPAGLAVFLVVVLEAPVVLWSLLAVAPVVYWHFTRTTAVLLGPERPGRGTRVLPPGGTEPAYASYWARQVWSDCARATAGGAGDAWHHLRDHWLRGRVRQLMVDRYAPTGPRRGPVRLCAARFWGAGVAAGAVTGTLAATAGLTVVLLLFGVLLAATCGALATTAVTVRGLDAGRLRLGRIRMRCPYPGCYRPVVLPVYHCPGCQVPHRNLRPGRYGVLRRVCGCGTALPTSFLTGRHRLAAECRACHRPLPAGLGSARLVHVPLIGGTSSGKTMLLLAMVAGLRALAEGGRLRLAFALDADRVEYDRVRGELARGGWALKTQMQLPRAFMLRVGTRRRRRLLYLYDPKGETMESAETMREQQYLAHADGVLLVMDLLADRHVRRSLTAEDRARADAAAPSTEGPADTYERLTAEFSALSRRRRRTAVAAVVTKRDVLYRTAWPAAPTGPVRTWLADMGLDNLVRAVEHDFGPRGYWAVSAHAATGPQACEAELRHVVEPLLWLLSRSGLRVKGAGGMSSAPPNAPARPPGTKGEAPDEGSLRH
ncbi:hypothetical protein [Streptomyces sp. NPDC003077]|uniref:TRAFAC clade GTPase domain-containing protein n=1 Tax=Streptomyces sp. NPDC003077 TaxID=3154443 RepID=UPI0033A07141